MRWPNRHPHSLTPGMRHAQGVMAEFSRLIDWRHFASRRPRSVSWCSLEELVAYACSDEHQAMIWVLRDKGLLGPTGISPSGRCSQGASVEIPSLGPGTYDVDFVETWNGHTLTSNPTSKAGRAGSS